MYTMRVVPIEMKESEWIQSLIEAFKDLHNANDLVKISVILVVTKRL